MTNPVRIRGKTYRSQREAARDLGVSETCLAKRLERGTEQTLGAERPLTGPKSAIPCVVDGVRYRSMTEAKRVLGLSNGAFEARRRRGEVRELLDERPSLTSR